MQQISTSQAVNRYHLINWDRPTGPLKPKVVELTSIEAHQLNYSMALNGQTTRYIRIDNV